MWESKAAQLARYYGLTPASELVAQIPGATWKDMTRALPNPVERHHYGDTQETCHLEPYYNAKQLPKDWKNRVKKYIIRRENFDEIDRLCKLFRAYHISLPKAPKELNDSCLISYINRLQIKLDKALAKARQNGKSVSVINILMPQD